MTQGTLKHLFDLVPAAVLGGLLGFLGSIITVIVTWAKDRNRDAKCIQVIDEATKYVQFWDQRYKTLQALAPSESSLLENRNAALIEIDGATAFLTGRIQRILGATEAPKPIPTNKIRRWYMLYKPNKWTSWLVRLFFYIYAFMGIVVGVELLGFAIVGFEDMPRLLALALAPVVPVVCYAVAWPMRLLAEWFDQRQKSNFALVTGSFTTEGVSATQPRKSAVGA